MVLKKTLDELKELGCLNPEEYKNTNSNNLLWLCKDCGETYHRGLTYQRKSTKLCVVCAKLYGATVRPNKIKEDTLVSMGCLNPQDYVNNTTANLTWQCTCGVLYVRSYHSQRRSSTCTTCSFKKISESLKLEKSILLTAGCLNPQDYVNNTTTNLKWVCQDCGNHFVKSRDAMLTSREYRCKKCALRYRSEIKKVNDSRLVSLGCLNPQEYQKNSTTNLKWVCKDCSALYVRSLQSQEKSTGLCVRCAHKHTTEKRKHTTETIAASGVVNPEEYINNKTKNLKYPCDTCGKEFLIGYNTLTDKRTSKHFCPSCSNSVSSQELEIVEFLKSFYKGTIETNIRDIIPPLELDIYLPDLKLGIELNGVYWHSSKHKDRNYHKSKFLACKEKGIKLLQFWDVTWNKKKDIVKSMLRTQMTSNTIKVFARTCSVKEVDLTIAKSFLDTNHLQGFGTGSTKYLGLFKDDTMVSLMTFKDIGDNVWDLTRFCSLKETSVIGGASKLLKYFIRTQKPTEIISFSDNMYSDGALYRTLGFTEVSQLRPDYKYLDKDELQHKFGYRHSKLKLKLENYNKTLTEKENCENHNIHQVFDAGKIKWSLTIK